MLPVIVKEPVFVKAQHTTSKPTAASRTPARAVLWAVLLACCALLPRGEALEPVGLMRGFGQGHLLLTTRNRCIFFDIYIAGSQQQRAQGLMHVEQMGLYEGMLFPYPRMEVIRMWMKNTNLPLDMLFAKDDGRIAHIHENAIPHDTTIISSTVPVSMVVELNAGAADRFGIAPGDRIGGIAG